MTLYYKAQQAALANRQPFHVVAILLRGKSVIRIAVNSVKTHPENLRGYANGGVSFHHHAETHALIRAKPGDRLVVLRFHRSGRLTCALPCEHCQRRLAAIDIVVYYSDWAGQVQRLN